MDRALEVMATLYEHHHYQAWWEPRYLEYYDPLRGDPRFETIMENFSNEMARQRESLAAQPELSGL